MNHVPIELNQVSTQKCLSQWPYVRLKYDIVSDYTFEERIPPNTNVFVLGGPPLTLLNNNMVVIP